MNKNVDIKFSAHDPLPEQPSSSKLEMEFKRNPDINDQSQQEQKL